MRRRLGRFLSVVSLIVLAPALAPAEQRQSASPASESAGTEPQTGQLKDSEERRPPEARNSRRREHREDFRRQFSIYSPYRAEKLEKLGRRHPEESRALMRDIASRMRAMERFRRTDMEEYRRQLEIIRLEDQIEKLADDARAARETAPRARLREELMRKLEELFDFKEQAQRARIGRMEKEIAELKAKLDQRRGERAKLIERRLHQMTEERQKGNGL